MEKISVKMQKISSVIPTPAYETSGAAGVDLRAFLPEDLVLCPGERKRVPTGLLLEIPPHVVGLVFARSGYATKYGIHLANGVGVVDSDYRGEIQVVLQNSSQEAFWIKNGDRIAQLAFLPVFSAEFLVAASLSETERGAGGFGSTGK